MKTKTRSNFWADEAAVSSASGVSVRRGAISARSDSSDANEPDRSDEDQDSGDVPAGVDEDALEHDELDTDRVTSTEALGAAVARDRSGFVVFARPGR